MKTSALPPNDLPCPACLRKTLTCGMQMHMGTESIGFPGVEVDVVTLSRRPAIWCTAPACHFVQWGRLVDGYVVFGDGAR